ncbi:hypothetical protein ACA910_003743 [Epithemia clementina (nom. ined.)]
MALIGQDDDFFGSDDDYDDNHYQGVQDKDGVRGRIVSNDVRTGMAAAETKAMEEQYHKLGFHDGYEKAEEEMLQKGFEQGYAETFEVATRIGSRMGALTFLHHFHHDKKQEHDKNQIPLNNNNRQPTTWNGDEGDCLAETRSSIVANDDPPDYYLRAIQATSDYLSTTQSTNHGFGGTMSTDDGLTALESVVEQIFANATSISAKNQGPDEVQPSKEEGQAAAAVANES